MNVGQECRKSDIERLGGVSGITLGFGALISVLVVLVIAVVGGAWQLSSGISELGVRMDSVENRMGSIENRMSSLENRVDSRIDGVEKQLNSRIDGLEKQLNSRIDGLEKQVNSRIDGLKERMDSLESEVRGINQFLREGKIESSSKTSATSGAEEDQTNDGIHNP